MRGSGTGRSVPRASIALRRLLRGPRRTVRTQPEARGPAAAAPKHSTKAPSGSNTRSGAARGDVGERNGFSRHVGAKYSVPMEGRAVAAIDAAASRSAAPFPARDADSALRSGWRADPIQWRVEANG